MRSRHVEVSTDQKILLDKWRRHYLPSRMRLIWLALTWRRRKGPSLIMIELHTPRNRTLFGYEETFKKLLPLMVYETAILRALRPRALFHSVSITFPPVSSQCSRYKADVWYRCHMDQLRSIQRIMARSTLEWTLARLIGSRRLNTLLSWLRHRSM